VITSHACGAVWVQHGSQTGHCCACHLTFASEQAFDAHRVTTQAGRGCLDPANKRLRDGSAAFIRKHDGQGIVWSHAASVRVARHHARALVERLSGTPTSQTLVSVPGMPPPAPEGRRTSALGVPVPA
jgi:hypothetical protein